MIYTRFTAISLLVGLFFVTMGGAFAAAAQPPYSVLFVGATSGGDAVLIEHLESLGLAVAVKDAKETQPADAELYSMVYVSESVASDKVADKFNATGTPVMLAEHYVADDMEFAGTAKNIHYGQTPERYRQLTITQPEHPLAAGLSGSVTIYNADGKFGFSQPAGDVEIIAVVPDDESKVILYAYEQGAQNMKGGVVPGRRVFFYLFAGQETKQTEDGWKLFDAAVQWCLEAANPMVEETKSADGASKPAGAVLPIPTEGLAAYWNLNENAGTTAADSSGNGNNGALQNTDQFVWSGGVAKNGVNLDGVDDYILVPHADAIDFGDEDFTLSLWIVQTDPTHNGRYLLKGSFRAPKTGKRYEIFHHHSGQVRFSIDDDVVKSEIQLPSKDFVTGQWVNIVAVRDTQKNELRLYAHGELKGTAQDGVGDISQTEELLIGGSTDENSYHKGFLDEVRIYNRVLADEEIQALAAAYPEAVVPEQKRPQPDSIKTSQGTPPEPFTGTPAFPGAEGFGMGSQGGRGGTVYKVTNLNDSGPGSLRAAVEASGPRIVIFEVGGTIQLQSGLNIRNDFITIAGQTAPGDGITLRDYPITIDANHVILRYLRVRLGDEARQETDAIWVAGGRNIIIDHCSAGWAVDETLSVSQGRDPTKKFLDNVTVQWCVISESLNQSVHAKGAHGYGSLVRGYDGAKITFHHNLWAHHASRMPRPGNYQSHQTDPLGALMDFRNNVFYNWGGNHSGYNADTESITQYNFINNYYLQGPNSAGAKAFDESCQFARAYFAGNYMNEAEPVDPWSLVTGVTGGAYKLANPLPAGTIGTDSAPEAYQRILARGGVSNVRDAVDQRVLNDVVQRTGQIINSAQDVGGWPVLNSGTAPLDSDGDGMPDAWETAQGLNPGDNRDGNLDRDGDGYTNLEEYLNSLVPE